mgnify:CR=1 FL=1
MKVLILNNCSTPSGQKLTKGIEVDLISEYAKQLIQNGDAEEVTTAPVIKKKGNRVKTGKAKK